jgi:lipopolysaccharide transport system ATP-binding protein
MYVRLAFSVAAHLEPEILIVDEVLAVGDTAFQRKCIARMTSVADEGRTVLFVSHNMSVLQGLCRRGIVLRSGQVIADTTIEEATAVYLRTLETARGVDLADHTGRRGWHHVRLREAKVSAADPAAPLATGSRAAFEFRFDTLVPLPPNSGLSLTFTLYNDLGQPIATFSSVHAAPSDATHQLTDLISCIVDELPLVAGRYRIDVALRGAGHLQDEVQGALWFDVEHGLFRGRPTPETAFGSTVIPHVWRLPSDV